MAVPNEPHIRVDHLSKSFLGRGGLTRALSDVSLTIDRGSFVTLLGPSGCGKSTLLRIIGGLETAESGECVVSSSHDHLVDSAMVFQGGGLFPWLTVLRNTTFPLELEKAPKKSREDIARFWLDQVGLAGFENSYPHQLSGGMRQRVAIARAFASGHDLLLMDEPLGALDAQTRSLMQEQLLDLWQRNRKTVVFVTHSIDEALLLGDRVVMMSARPGRVREDITVPFERPRDAAVLASGEFADLRSELWGLLKDEVADSLLVGGERR